MKKVLVIAADELHLRNIRHAELFSKEWEPKYILAGEMIGGLRFDKILVFDRFPRNSPVQREHLERWLSELQIHLYWDSQGIHYV